MRVGLDERFAPARIAVAARGQNMTVIRLENERGQQVARWVLSDALRKEVVKKVDLAFATEGVHPSGRSLIR